MTDHLPANSFPAVATDAAAAYLARGFAPIPLVAGSKRPAVADWPNYRAAAETLVVFTEQNVGLLLGEPSGGLVDVDLDCAEAVRAADLLLPATGLVFGRASAPRSHRLYVSSDTSEPVKLTDPVRRAEHPDGGVLVEIRANRQQTMCPPSVHPDGETVEWAKFDEPATVSATELTAAVKTVAAAALLGRYWPNGNRHDAALALAGGLLRAGWATERVEAFVRAVCSAAEDEEVCDRVAAVADTAAKLAADGRQLTGWPRLAALVGAGVVDRVRDWLEVGPAPPAQAVTPPPPDWPAAMHAAAFHGLAGEVVRAIAPHTEADPVAILAQLLVAFGSVIGRTAHVVVEATRHHTNEFLVLVGQSAKARKGTSWGHVERLFVAVDGQLASDGGAVAGWSHRRVASGLSSGEGLIWAVRDPIEKPNKEGEMVVVDEGEADKRFLVQEAEFAGVLKAVERQGNTLSPVVRQAWESGRLRSLTKNSPGQATGAHISIVGHITAEEMRRYLTQTEMANGFGNRFLWLAVRRAQLLPEGGRPDQAVMAGFADRLAAAVRFAAATDEVERDESAREVWRAMYPELSRDRPGLAGHLLGRAEPHVLRLALLYALLDRSAVIRAEHLVAAAAVWDYCERSVLFLFGDSLGDPLADDLLGLIRGAGPAGVTRTEVTGYLGRNVPADRLNRALGLLLTHRLAHAVREGTGGRPTERWRAGPPPA